MPGAFCTRHMEGVMLWIESPHMIPVPWHWGSRRKGREFLTVAETPYKSRKGAQRPGWVPLVAASSSLGHLGPRRSRETPGWARLPAFVREPVAGRWRWDGCHRVIPAGLACPCSPSGAAGWRDTVQGLPEGTRRPLPRSSAGREISDTAAFPEVRGGLIPGSAVSAHVSFPAQPVTPACQAECQRCGVRPRVGSPSGQAVWSRPQSSSPSPGGSPSQTIFAAGSPAAPASSVTSAVPCPCPLAPQPHTKIPY